MTIAAKYYPRGNRLRKIPVQPRLFTVAPESQVLGLCHWQPEPRRCDTVVLVHGLEGCGDSHYMKGIAAKAWNAGLNVIRLNQRTCGASEHLTMSLYNCGLSGDIEAVIKELIFTDRLNALSVIGYSMGGNLVLKMAGEIADTLPSLLGVFAVSPVIDPSQCVAALERTENRLYHNHFLKSLKARMIRKAHLYPGKWDLRPLPAIQTIREFDGIYTAPDGGYQSAAHYYEQSGARHVLHRIRISTVIITADDDPFVPRATFDIPAIIANPFIHLITTPHGGHCGFFQRRRANEDSYWAENRLIELISSGHGHSRDQGESIHTRPRDVSIPVSSHNPN